MPWPFTYTGGYDPDKTRFYQFSRRLLFVFIVYVAYILLLLLIGWLS